MNWFDGNVVEAIQISKSRKSIFLVCIIGNFFIKLRFCTNKFSIISSAVGYYFFCTTIFHFRT